jgi:hypothetical protein
MTDTQISTECRTGDHNLCDGYFGPGGSCLGYDTHTCLCGRCEHHTLIAEDAGMPVVRHRQDGDA